MEHKYNIKVVSNSCGIKPHTLRIWEQRYGIFNPDRSEGGQRLYSEEDLKKARLLSTLTKQGHAISKLAEYPIEELESMIPKFNKKNTSKEIISTTIKSKKLLGFLEEYKIDSVAAELQHLRTTMGVKSFIFDIVLPTMKAVGEYQANGKYTISQEHIISAIVRDQLSQIHLPQTSTKVHHMALATPEGNLHELSLLMADILCRSNRIPTHYLGPSHPADCLGEAVSALNVPILVLGAVTSDLWNYDQKIISFLQQLDKSLKTSVHIIIGGGTIKAFGKFKHISKVTVFATLEEFDQYLVDLI